MNKRGMSYFTLILLLFALAVGMIYTEADNMGLDKNNITEKLEISLRNATSLNLTFNTPETPEIGNAIGYYMNGLFLAMSEVGIWMVHFVEENPQAPYKLILYLLIFSLFAPIIIVLFKLIIIIFLLTKEYLQKRKEKKEIQKYTQ